MYIMKKASILFLTFILLVTNFLINLINPTIAKANTNVEEGIKKLVVFEDKNLEKHIINTIGKNINDITEKDLESVTKISIPIVENITSLEGIQYCKNLTQIDISTSSSDISQLSELINLTSIEINAENITNLDFVKKLKNLTCLQISGKKLTDVNALDSLCKLSDADISSPSLTSFPELKHLSNLKSLEINCDNLSNICSLQYLTNLDYLHIKSTKITNLKSLNALSNLWSLDIICPQLNSLEGFQNLVNLHTLAISPINTTDFSPLKSLTNLNSLYIYNILPIYILKNTPNIHLLCIRGKDVWSLSGLENCRDLNELVIEDTSISDLTQLNSLSKLSTINIANSPISDFKYIENSINLTKLTIRNCNLTKIPSLQNLHNLNHLDLANNYINNIDADFNLDNLYTLDLSDNEISDLTPLLEKSKNCSNKHRNIDFSYNLIDTDKEYLDSFKVCTDFINNSYKKSNIHLLNINNDKYIYDDHLYNKYLYYDRTRYNISANRKISLTFSENITPDKASDIDNNIKIYDKTTEKYYNVNCIINDNVLEIEVANELPINDDLYIYTGNCSISGMDCTNIPIKVNKDLSCDVNRDDKVDLKDLSIIANDYNKQFSTSGTWNKHEDCIPDGIIDIYDLSYICSELE